jgi:hypothetical protein
MSKIEELKRRDVIDAVDCPACPAKAGARCDSTAGVAGVHYNRRLAYLKRQLAYSEAEELTLP